MDELDLGATLKGFSAGQKAFGRYTLRKMLGRGGMGVVWLASDDELGRDIALKFLPEMVASDRAAIDELKREVRRAIDLAHPHIVKTQNFETDSRLAAVSMEYVAGDTLSSLRVDQPGRVFSAEQLTKWTGQLCAALDYAHGPGEVVHRDLKPANLMVNARGDLKILDFGIAASLSESVTRVSKQAGSSGTPVYMSPQQMMGEKPSVTDDIYALGATLYELLTGKPPFYAGNIVLQVQSKPPPSLADRRAELGVSGEPIPRTWEATIAACLAKEPKDRPQSAGEVAERLGLAAKGNTQRPTSSVQPSAKPSSSTPPSGATPPTAADRRKPTAHWPLVAAAVLLLGGLGWYFGAYAPEQKRTAAEAARLAAARGGLVIHTTPSGAEVQVGAIALDKSPLTLKDQKLGKYPVHVRLAGYEDWNGEMEVKENEFSERSIALVRSTGRVVLTGTAGATVTTGAGPLGTLPLSLDRVPTGRVQYSVALKGYQTAEISGEVLRNGELRLAAILEKQPFPQPDQPWENTLGQKFVPVPGTNVLFAIWETREMDYAEFVRATGHDWSNPNAGSAHPAGNANWADAVAFCAWLTEKERRAGRLASGQEYRLPTDAEWSLAVGLHEGSGTPQDKDRGTRDVYPWGTAWLPPRGSGNYADEAAKRMEPNMPVIHGYEDGYAETAPVGSFAANRFGLHDLGGNVWEWCADWYNAEHYYRVLRGGSFDNSDPNYLLSAERVRGSPPYRYVSIGFRVAIAFSVSATAPVPAKTN